MNAFVHDKRGAMTPKRRAQIFLAAGGKCHKCTRVLRPSDDWDADHIIALECGGTDDDSNLAPICDWCHTTKTADDHGKGAKGKRIATKHNVPSRFKKSNGWRR